MSVPPPRPQRPVGYRFRPFMQFLIKLLQFKAAGGGDITGCTEYPEDLYEFDVYGPGKEPWNLFSGEHEILALQDVSKRWIKEKYVLTQLSKIGQKNASRTAGAGTWADQGILKHVNYSGHEMGDWRSLNYVYWGNEAVGDRHHYTMHELQLSKYALGQVQAKHDDFVICRVMKDESKLCRVRRGKKRVRQQDDFCPAAKKMKKHSQEEATCSTVVPEDDFDFGQCIDFPELGQQETCVAADFCGFEQGQKVPSFDHWDCPQLQGTCSVHDCSDPGYVPDVCGVGQQQISEPWWDYEQPQPNSAPSCSSSTMPDQDFDFDFLTDNFNIEEMTELLERTA